MAEAETDIKRVNYFIGQFLEDEDFLDEQRYHVEMRRRRNRLQYGPGILDGLAVTQTAVAQITVGAGTAVDNQGRELVVLVPQAVNVTGGANATVFVTIMYAETQLPEDHRSKGGYADFIRVTERPQIKIQAETPPSSSAGVDLLLATVQLDASGNITTVNTSVRQMAPMNLSGDIVVNGNIGVGAPTGRQFMIGSTAQGQFQIADLTAGGASRFIVEANGCVGIGTIQAGKNLEVVGNIITRVSPEAGQAAAGLAVESGGLGSLWTNASYDPARPGSGWKRAINMKDKNVGIGDEQNPRFPLSLGASLAKTKLAIYQAVDGSSHYGMGVTAGRFYFNIGNPQARFVFLNSAQADAKEVLIVDGNADLHFRNQVRISDRNVKTDIRPFREGLDIIEHMSPVTYRYNGLADTVEGPEDIGLIAQELNAIAPYLVSATRRKLRPADAEETELLSIKPMTIVYVLVNAVKELSWQLQALQKQVEPTPQP